MPPAVTIKDVAEEPDHTAQRSTSARRLALHLGPHHRRHRTNHSDRCHAPVILVFACGQSFGRLKDDAKVFGDYKFSLATRAIVALVCSNWAAILSDCGLFWSSYLGSLYRLERQDELWVLPPPCVVLPKRPSLSRATGAAVSVEDITELVIETLTICSSDPLSFGILANRLKFTAFSVMSRFTLVNGGRKAYNQGGRPTRVDEQHIPSGAREHSGHPLARLRPALDVRQQAYAGI
ncbi:hypothetical protein K438DRAFT_2141380 [Mycena galopus ATCC 62051]|nr:hypothetical protein K438DRAFT_2141380 [Mycena galopus ATCC 62051]